MKKHALLSASGAARWLVCTPSARLEEQEDEVESSYADEGTLAHRLAEILIIQIAYGIDVSERIQSIQSHELYSDEMLDHCTEFAKFVVERVRNAPKGAILWQEYRLELEEWIPEGFGTLDNAIGADKMIEIIDLKYGQGVPVDVFENKQLKIYALGTLRLLGLLYDFDMVRLTIYQPRINNIESYDLSVSDLIGWAEKVVKPTAIIAFKGEGDLVAGDHCKFCRIKAKCSEFARHNLAMAARDFDPPTMSDENIAKVLLKAKQIKNWVTSVEQYALREALQGKQWPGLKLIQGRSNRKIADEKTLVDKLKEARLAEDQIYKKKVNTLTELKKLLGAKKFRELVEPYLFKPPGKPALVIETDGRPAWDTNLAAAADFKDETEDAEFEIEE